MVVQDGEGYILERGVCSQALKCPKKAGSDLGEKGCILEIGWLVE